MKAVERLDNTMAELNKINESELGINELDLLRFLKNQLSKSKSLFESFSKSIDEKRWDDVLSYTFQISQRVNSIFGYLVQPAVFSMISRSKLSENIENIIDSLAFSVSEMIIVLKQNNKSLGIDTITVNMSSNPPSMSISVVIKGG
ncbi:conserved hypothetical protein [Sulfolobus islandicus Y.G.57.14]|jgi:DNA repair ATPase RecN|uniref:Uncharacterized protein n=8 Tax=Saccharolobus islandicus TaxID=43080 RepID=M9U659_SACIS|nr:hypothetical protein [Sulfolobus islandicus]ACP36985.1 conserved hypothetical protein [Sulfolobus islandicus M.14.25]ACP44389.1 conserved hypothetical protein [Sulfolobus islandicus Y.G.57.14]ACP47291.1 conserved hypothetical protein [Sulfolobus islandicus Y.N.15.51]ACP54122.1 conserved hypothetical protein [Sulfolobus islandicus M.16.27]ACR40729.1 conserved hypothetical protein [Sulfolobus islandicus M.16.4]